MGVQKGIDAMPRRAVPARYPAHGAWPCEMRADTAAAYLDFEDTTELYRAISRGEAPRPTGYRHRAGKREPTWSLEACRSYVARRHELAQDVHSIDQSIRDLV
jgi:hypothetical protein